MGSMEIFKEFSIEAAHWLPNVPAGAQVRPPAWAQLSSGIACFGTCGPASGLGSGLCRCQKAFKGIEDQIDHRCLNEVAGLENPTSENLARWLWLRLKPELPALSSVVVKETCTSGCIYTGE